MIPFKRALLTCGRTALCVAGIAGAQAGWTTDLKSVPARLPADFEIALNQVASPWTSESAEFTLYCVTDVTKSGRPRHNTCLPDPTFDVSELRKTIVKLMRRFRLSPAVLDGNTIATEFYYRVHFDSRGASPEINVYPNWGHSSDLHGTSYDAPQRHELRSFPPDCLFFVGIATTPVDMQGNAAEEPEVSTRFSLEEPTLDCIEKIKTRHRNARYIPAFRDGKPVASIHAEVWGDPEKAMLDSPVAQ